MSSMSAMSGPTYSGISLVVASYQPDLPPTKHTFKQVTRAALKDVLQRSSLAGLVPLSKLPAAGMPLDEVALELPEHVELADGGTYLGVHLAAPIEQQVDALQSWQDSTAQAGPDQVAATQHAVSWLREAGHSEADTLCVKYLRAAGIEVEVDGVALADGCAAIVEAKAELTSWSASSLAVKMATIRAMVESAEPSTVCPRGAFHRLSHGAAQGQAAAAGPVRPHRHLRLHRPRQDGPHLPAAPDRVLGHGRVGCGAELGQLLPVALRAPRRQEPRDRDCGRVPGQRGHTRGRCRVGAAQCGPAVRSPRPRHAQPAHPRAPALRIATPRCKGGCITLPSCPTRTCCNEWQQVFGGSNSSRAGLRQYQQARRLRVHTWENALCHRVTAMASRYGAVEGQEVARKSVLYRSARDLLHLAVCS